MFVCKTHRQHNSIVMTIPVGVCRHLEIKAGDHVTMGLCTDGHSYNFKKLQIGGQENAGDNKHKHRKDKGGGT